MCKISALALLELIKAHDGSLLLESEEGKGSTFSFTLPVHEQEAE
jgi:signal transduction histidine kinase